MLNKAMIIVLCRGQLVWVSNEKLESSLEFLAFALHMLQHRTACECKISTLDATNFERDVGSGTWTMLKELHSRLQK